jgi:hypothetical protein
MSPACSEGEQSTGSAERCERVPSRRERQLGARVGVERIRWERVADRAERASCRREVSDDGACWGDLMAAE